MEELTNRSLLPWWGTTALRLFQIGGACSNCLLQLLNEYCWDIPGLIIIREMFPHLSIWHVSSVRWSDQLLYRACCDYTFICLLANCIIYIRTGIVKQFLMIRSDKAIWTNIFSCGLAAKPTKHAKPGCIAGMAAAKPAKRLCGHERAARQPPHLHPWAYVLQLFLASSHACMFQEPSPL